jgi:nucleoside-diphosphate-sugar epimerase
MEVTLETNRPLRACPWPVKTGRITVGISGASGFLGRFAAGWLAERGYPVRTFTRGREQGAPSRVEVRCVAHDADVSAWTAACMGCETILHLAGRAHVMEEGAVDPLAAYRAVNVEVTRRALEGAAAAGCRTFIFASSVKAMGERTTIPWTEDTPPAPVDPYGVSKLEAEAVVEQGGKRLGLRTVSLRLPALYGPGMRANMLRLFRAVARGTPLPLGRIENRRSFLFAGNAAAAMEAVMLHPGDLHPHYLLSDGVDVSTPELIRAIARAVDRHPRLIPIPPGVFRLAGRVGDRLPPWLPWPMTTARAQRLMDSLQVESSRIRKDLGFTPPYSMADGMQETVMWLRSLPGQTV